MDDILLIIDMQNVYKKDQPWECKNLNKIIPNILKLISTLKKNIIFTKFIASKNPIGIWKEYNKLNESINKNEYLNEIIEELKKESEKYPTYTKSTYSSLQIPEIKELALKNKRLIITGVVAECCVLSTCFEAIDLGIKVIYLSDAISGIDDNNEKSCINILLGLSPIQVEIMTTDKYIQSLSK